jgi:hypothetical protein
MTMTANVQQSLPIVSDQINSIRAALINLSQGGIIYLYYQLV